MFGVKRKENQSTISVGLNWVPAKTWRVSPQLSHTQNQSHIAIYDYDRTVLSISARKEF